MTSSEATGPWSVLGGSTAVPLTLVVLLAICCRLTGLTGAAAGGVPRLLDPKAHGDVRRIEAAARSFPRAPSARDPLASPPEGARSRSTFGYQMLAGGLVRLVGLGRAEWAAMGLVVGLGALSAALAMLLALRLGAGRGWALLSGLMLAVWPAHVEYSRLSRVGPEAAGPPLVLLYFIVLLGGLERARSGRRGAGVGVGAGLVLGGSFWFAPSMLWPGVALGCAALLAGRAVVGASRIGVRVAAGALAALLPALALDPVPPSILEGLSLAALLLAASTWLGFVGGLPRRRRPVAGVLGVAGLVLLAALVTPLGAAATDTWWAMLGLNVAGLNLDQRPLLLLPLRHVVLLTTHLLFVLPALLWLAAGGEVAGGPGRASRGALALCAGVLVGLGLLQLRDFAIAAALCAPLCALGLQRASSRLRTRLEGRPERRWVAPALVTLTVYLLSPSIDYLAAYRLLPGAARRAQQRAFGWLGAHAAAGEVVLAPLFVGHAAASASRRAVAGQQPRRAPSAADRDAIAFFTARDPARARRIAVGRGVAWVVGSRFTSDYFLRLRQVADPLADEAQAATEYRRSMGCRLQTDSGAAARQGSLELPPLRWLQHRHEARLFGSAFGRWSAAQLFRVVPGARLVGRARPRELVTLTTVVETATGRRFVYRDDTRADGSGRYALTVPYATEPIGDRAASRVVGRVRLETTWGERRVRVRQADVLGGRRVDVPAMTPVARRAELPSLSAPWLGDD